MGKPRLHNEQKLPGTVWGWSPKFPANGERADGHLVGFESSPQASDGGVLCVCSRRFNLCALAASVGMGGQQAGVSLRQAASRTSHCEPSTLPAPEVWCPELWVGGGAGAMKPDSPHCGKAGRPWAGHFPYVGSVSHQCRDRLNTEIPWLCIYPSSIPEGPLVGRKVWCFRPGLRPFNPPRTQGADKPTRKGVSLSAFSETRPWTAAQYS